MSPGGVPVTSCLSQSFSKIRVSLRSVWPRFLSNYCLRAGTQQRAWGVRFCVCPLKTQSLFPTALWLSCTQALLAFKARCSESSSSWCKTPGWASYCGTWSPHSLGRTSAVVITLLFWGHLPRDVDLICTASPLSYPFCRGSFLIASCAESLLLIFCLFSQTAAP